MAIKASRKKAEKDIAESYNKYKLFHGKQYTGMKVGRSLKWHYDKGVWTDKKVTPEKWLINFEVKKRRAGKAPEGSGVPVGTEYHWYILAHQLVKKLDANTYSTSMNGVKFKLSHKRSTKQEWNINDKKQKQRLIKILQNFIKELEQNEEVEIQENTLKSAVKTATRKKAAKKSRKKEAVLV